MGKFGTTEILLLFLVLVVFILIPVISYRLGFRSGRMRGERDAMLRMNQNNQNK